MPDELLLLTLLLLLLPTTDLCRLCQETGAYMLAVECFEERWKFPKAYHLFYDHFFKAAVGDRKWKASLEGNKPFGNSNTEAFALMVLKNNYLAWMAQASSEFEFENQYNLEIEARKRKEQEELQKKAKKKNGSTGHCDGRIYAPGRSILEEILPNIQYWKILSSSNNKKNKHDHVVPMEDDVGNGIGVIADAAAKRQLLRSYDDDDDNDVVVEKDDDDEDDTTTAEESETSTLGWSIVTPDGDPDIYLQAMVKNEECLARARSKIVKDDLDLYSSAVESLQYLNSNVESEKTVLSGARQRGLSSRTALLMGLEEGNNGTKDPTEDVPSPVPLERRQSNTQTQTRRKVLKDLKRFTKKGDCRNPKQKGWTNEGYRYHEVMTLQILEEETRNKPLVNLYSKITQKIELKMAEIAHPNKKQRYIPNRSKVWQLG